ncbi:MAG: CRISPR-associated endonuclease Cas2 [Tenuifilaceae bacterium]
MTFERLNAYRIMWILVLYDLPTETRAQRKASARFRKNLLGSGFSMFQFSAYIRHVASSESAEVQKRSVKSLMPEMGAIGILEITDKQFEKMEIYYGRKTQKTPKGPVQLELF